MALFAFHLRLAPELFRVLVPGAHVILATQGLVSHLVIDAFCTAGFEARGQIVRYVKTLRGGDRPKFGEKKFREVSVIPRSSYEPWLLFRKPCDGRVAENLKRFGTGALRRPSVDVPFSDFIEASPPRSRERTLSNHPSLKPQSLMRALVRAALPLGRGRLLDPFMGGGSTIAAAKNLGLNSVGVELDAKFFLLAKKGIPKLAKFDPSNSTSKATGTRRKKKPNRGSR
jgi:DNA methylase